MTVLLGCRDAERGGARPRPTLRAGGADAHAIALDVTDEDVDAGPRPSASTPTYGRLDILVNNAGIAMGDGAGRPSGTTLADAAARCSRRTCSASSR